MDLTSLPAEPAPSLDPARYAIGGRAPRGVQRPTSAEELSETVRAAARDGQTIVPWGGGSALPLEAAPGRYDLAIDLGGLDRMIEYEPEDLTLTAECGLGLARLAEITAERGQELPLEAPNAARATLGGVLSANASGPRRLRLGGPRDRILGGRFVLGDGSLVRTGGRVVKNVAGYAIHRLLCGARGGLAILVEASLKLLPAPERRVALIYEASPASLADSASWSALRRREPAAITVVGREHARHLPGAPRPGRFWLCVGLEDDAAFVTAEEARLRTGMGEPAARLEGDAVRALWRQLCDLEDASESRLSFSGPQGTPADLARLLADARASAVTDRAIFHAPAGRLHLIPGAAVPADLVAAAAGAGFRLVDRRGVAFSEPPLPAATARLRGRIREALDPGGRFELGGRWIGSQ